MLILVFAELIPKTAGVSYSRPLSALVAHPLQVLVWVFRPLIRLTVLITRLVSRDAGELKVSADELLLMARLGRKTGGIDSGEARVIQGILSLEDKTVGQIMTPRTVMFSVSAGLTVKQMLEQHGVLNFSRVPVFGRDADDIVGVVHHRELLKTLAEGRSEVKPAELMQPAEFVSHALPLDRLLSLLLKRGRHLVVAHGEFGEVAGLVTLEDTLEEILGREIVDETDQVADMRELARRQGQRILDDAVGEVPPPEEEAPAEETEE